MSLNIFLKLQFQQLLTILYVTYGRVSNKYRGTSGY